MGLRHSMDKVLGTGSPLDDTVLHSRGPGNH